MARVSSVKSQEANSIVLRKSNSLPPASLIFQRGSSDDRFVSVRAFMTKLDQIMKLHAGVSLPPMHLLTCHRCGLVHFFKTCLAFRKRRSLKEVWVSVSDLFFPPLLNYLCASENVRNFICLPFIELHAFAPTMLADHMPRRTQCPGTWHSWVY